jgi:AcrR family transcriptional regulator
MITEATRTGPTDGRRVAAAARRRKREAEILAATRALFDERGVRDAQIDDVAKAVGINRAIIYRHFTGKEDLFALTVVGYLTELEQRLVAADDERAGPEDRLKAMVRTFFDYGIEFPAFVDCAQSLMRKSGAELFAEVSEGTMLKLGRGLSACLKKLTDVVTAGNESGVFKSPNVDLTANMLYASGLGALQLARVGLVVHEAAPGVPMLQRIAPELVREQMVTAAVTMIGVGEVTSRGSS